MELNGGGIVACVVVFTFSPLVQQLMLEALQLIPAAVLAPEDWEQCYTDLIDAVGNDNLTVFGNILHHLRSLCRS